MARPRGRPPLFDARVNSRLTLHVTPAQRVELRRIAVDNGMRVSTFVREAIDEAVTDCRQGRIFRRLKI